MDNIKTLFKKTKNQPIDIWLFFLFLLSFSLSVRKVVDYFPVERTDQRTFNEYAGIYVYMSDIFLTLAIVCWIVSILYNNYIKQSSVKLWITLLVHRILLYFKNIVPPARYASKFHADSIISKTVKPDKEGTLSQLHSEAGGRGTIKNNEADVERFSLQASILFIIPLLLVIWSFISTFWAKNETVALFRSIKLLEFYLLYVYVALRLIPLFHAEHKSATILTKNQSHYTPHENSFDKVSMIVPRGTIIGVKVFDVFIWLIIFIGVFQSIIAIWQFIIQHSVGLFWLKESLISPDVPGVAKIVLNSHKIIRAYGLFPHPNILGGFLLFSIILTLLYKKCSTWNNANGISTVLHQSADKASQTIEITTWTSQTIRFLTKKLSLRKVWLIQASLFIQALALFLTFSKSAIIGIIIALVYINVPPARYASKFHANSSIDKTVESNTEGTMSQLHSEAGGRGTYDKKWIYKMFHVEQWHVFSLGSRKVSNTNKANKNSRNGNSVVPRGTMGNNPLKAQSHSLFGRKVILILVILILSLYLAKPDLSALFTKSLKERLFYLNVAYETILDNPIIGVGAGQFVLNIPQYANQTVEQWQFQPVHNIFLLIWSELGLVGVGVFLWFLWAIWRKSILSNDSLNLSTALILRYFKAIFLGFLFIMLFDHYLWDIQQGSLLLWTTLGLIASIDKSSQSYLNTENRRGL
ncbi:MAG: hypothetical protein QG620_122 [Patescibacteria group bacterium]|nr:hypothetical protein [Patescibacteria group bacterium]